MTVLLHGGHGEQKVNRKGIDMAVYASLNSFNAGELSPKMLGRVDVSQYAKGCQVLRNFLVTPYGAAERRPGTKFLCNAKFPDKRVRLIRFVYSSKISYVCEFGDHYIRFMKDDAPVMYNGAVLELLSPYGENDLAAIKFVQCADIMTLVHPSYPVQELKRTAVNFFTIAEKEFQYPPVLDPNLDDSHTITPSGLTGDITLTASHDTFTADNVGGYFQLIHTRQENEISMDFKADGVSDPIEVYGYWTFTTHGTWTGNITIQRSFDGGITWKDYRTYSSANDSNTSSSGEEENIDVLYRLSMSDYTASSTGTLKLCRCLFVNPDFVTTGVVRITGVTDAKNASGTVIRKLGGVSATNEWNEGAWSTRRGYPRTIAYYEERMMFGGNEYRPQTIWGSKTNAWDTFLTGSKDDDALEFTLASDTINTISWMCQHTALVIGTEDSEWTLSSSDATSALTPSNFQVRRQSVYGSAGVTAQMVGDVILFVQRGNRKVREFVYTWEKDGYSSPDMTILADHITQSGIAETALQQLPDSILWCVLNDGTVAALTYERDQEVIGWHKHITDGNIFSCCVIPDGNEDKVYFAVERNGRRMIESMAARNAATVEDSFFVDSGKVFYGDNLKVLTGLDHLEGKQVKILADGAVQREKIVTNGSVELDVPANKVALGLSYESLLSPMPIEIEMQNGQSVLRKKTIGELRIRLYSSVGGKVRCGGDTWQTIISRDVLEDTMDTAISLKNDVVILNMISGHEMSTNIELLQDDPLPFNITCIVATYDVAER